LRTRLADWYVAQNIVTVHLHHFFDNALLRDLRKQEMRCGDTAEQIREKNCVGIGQVKYPRIWNTFFRQTNIS